MDHGQRLRRQCTCCAAEPLEARAQRAGASRTWNSGSLRGAGRRVRTGPALRPARERAWLPRSSRRQVISRGEAGPWGPMEDAGVHSECARGPGETWGRQ